ncbi:MAG: imelysin family protein [Devosia sp.]
MRVLTLVAALIMSSPAAEASLLPERDIAQAAIDGYIRPAFHQFAEEAGSLRLTVEALCKQPSSEALASGQSQFKSTVVAFSKVEFVRIGPLGVGDRLERLLFWPDRKGIALRQVQGALAEKDETAASSDTLGGKSVAMQGLVALEYLLFGTGSDALATGDDYRCRYALASSTLISDMAANVDAEWADPVGVARHLLDPKAEYDDYRTSTEVLEKLAATLIHGTEAIRDQRVTPIIGDAQGAAKPKSALFWRSGMTASTLAANFEGMEAFFNAARLPEAIGKDNEWVSNGALFEFSNAERGVARLDGITGEAVGEEQLKGLRYLVIVTKSLDTLLGENLAAALGLSVGFSALDGD